MPPTGECPVFACKQSVTKRGRLLLVFLLSAMNAMTTHGDIVTCEAIGAVHRYGVSPRLRYAFIASMAP
jgi:hypothetical protein